MSVFKLGKFEVSNEAFIKGAVTAVGAGVFLLGIKNFLDARRIRLIRETPIDEDEEFEFSPSSAITSSFELIISLISNKESRFDLISIFFSIMRYIKFIYFNYFSKYKKHKSNYY